MKFHFLSISLAIFAALRENLLMKKAECKYWKNQSTTCSLDPKKSILNLKLYPEGMPLA
jgi:hypothetical protein